MLDFDARLFRLLHSALSGPLVLYVMAALTVIGAGWTLLAFLPLLAFARTRRPAAALIATCAATSVVVFTLKSLVQRARPCACLADIHARIFPAPSDYSFPSGHAAGAFACAAFAAVLVTANRPLTHRHRLAVAALFAVAAGIALSRIALGVHFPADVTAGALLGTTLGLLGARLHLRTERSS